MERMLLIAALVCFSMPSYAQAVYWCYNQQNGVGPWITTLNNSEITVTSVMRDGGSYFEIYPIAFRSEEWVIGYSAVECCTRFEAGELEYYYLDMIAFNLLENRSHHALSQDVSNQVSNPYANDVLIRNCTQHTQP
jgi:hypothetical protein